MNSTQRHPDSGRTASHAPTVQADHKETTQSRGHRWRVAGAALAAVAAVAAIGRVNIEGDKANLTGYNVQERTQLSESTRSLARVMVFGSGVMVRENPIVPSLRGGETDNQAFRVPEGKLLVIVNPLEGYDGFGNLFLGFADPRQKDARTSTNPSSVNWIAYDKLKQGPNAPDEYYQRAQRALVDSSHLAIKVGPNGEFRSDDRGSAQEVGGAHLVTRDQVAATIQDDALSLIKH